MTTLLELNRAVCALYRQVLDAAVPGADVVAEDVERPIVRPGGKVEMEDGGEALLLASGRERTVTFRLYFYATDRDRPKLENLAVREQLGAAFAAGLGVGELWLFPEDGVAFTVADGVLVATVDLSVNETVPETPAETMETLIYDTEVT